MRFEWVVGQSVCATKMGLTCAKKLRFDVEPTCAWMHDCGTNAEEPTIGDERNVLSIKWRSSCRAQNRNFVRKQREELQIHLCSAKGNYSAAIAPMSESLACEWVLISWHRRQCIQLVDIFLPFVATFHRPILQNLFLESHRFLSLFFFTLARP